MNSVVIGNIEVTGLAPREAQTLAHTALGLSGKETARVMGVSLRTVEMHLLHSRLRVGAKNSAQLINEAWMRGIIRARDALQILAISFLFLFSLTTSVSDGDYSDIPRRTARTLRIRRKDDCELTLLSDFD